MWLYPPFQNQSTSKFWEQFYLNVFSFEFIEFVTILYGFWIWPRTLIGSYDCYLIHACG